jgi:hypothetical protein
MMRHLLGILLCTLACPAAYGQTLFDLELAADLVAEGLGSSLPSYHTGMVFINDDTLLAIDRGQGIVIRVDLEPGVVAVPGPVVLDLDVIAAGDDHQSEYGVQGIAVHPDFAENGYVYIRYDQSPTPGVDTPQDEVVLGPNFSASHPTENVIERYIWVPDANGGNGELLFDSLIHSVTVDTRYHHGGKIVFGPDGTLHAIYGDLRRYAGGGWLPGQAGPLLSVNVKRGVEEDNGTVLRLNDDGTTPPDNPYDPEPVGHRERSHVFRRGQPDRAREQWRLEVAHWARRAPGPDGLARRSRGVAWLGLQRAGVQLVRQHGRHRDPLSLRIPPRRGI